MAISEWRARLQPASFRGVRFHVDVGSRVGGRRIALHEFPKRDTPYSEDMGRRAKRFSVTAYIIGPHYTDGRDALIDELEKEGSGQLIHPTSGTDTVVVETYSVVERRQRGGIAEFEIGFIEAGEDISTIAIADTRGAVTAAANNAAGVSTSVAANVSLVGGFQFSIDITGLQ